MLSNWIISLCFSSSSSLSAVWMYGFTDSPRKEASGSFVCLCQNVEYACTSVHVWARHASCIPFGFSGCFFSHLSFLLTSALHLLSSPSPFTHLLKFSLSLSEVCPSISAYLVGQHHSWPHCHRVRAWTCVLHVEKRLRLKWGVKSGSLHLSKTWPSSCYDLTQLWVSCTGTMSQDVRNGIKIAPLANKHSRKERFCSRRCKHIVTQTQLHISPSGGHSETFNCNWGVAGERQIHAVSFH